MNVYIRLFAILNFVNGAFMLIAPKSWYQTVPGVTDTRPRLSRVRTNENHCKNDPRSILKAL